MKRAMALSAASVTRYRFVNHLNSDIWFELSRHCDRETGQLERFTIRVKCYSVGRLQGTDDEFYQEITMADLTPPHNTDFIENVTREFKEMEDTHNEDVLPINRRNLVYMATYKASIAILEATTDAAVTIGFIDQLIWNVFEDNLTWLPSVTSLNNRRIYRYHVRRGWLDLVINGIYYETPTWLLRDQPISLRKRELIDRSSDQKSRNSQ